VTDKQKVSSWDILEGMKNPAPLSWAWFGAVRLERKPLSCEDTHRLLKYHTHNLQRPASHYLDPPPLPPEDLEPVPDKPLKDCDLKADTPSSVDQSPAAVGKGRGKGQRRPRKPKAVPGQLPVNAMGMNQPQMAQGQPGMSMQVPGPNPQMHNMPGYAQGPGMPQQGQQYANANNQQLWYGQQQQQPGYYPPQMANGEGGCEVVTGAISGVCS
jgi:mediator of RNA polymerase II transcription subunit 12